MSNLHSTIRAQADGSVQRWDAIVGRWVSSALPVATKHAEASPAPARLTPAALALPIATRGAAVPRSAGRMYASARSSRFNVGLGSSGANSADAELMLSLSRLRAASRQMVRDASYAKRARVLVVNNVIGPGIGMQGQVKSERGGLNKRVNDDIEAAWTDWCLAGSCHTGGALHFADLERMAMGQVFEAGEIFLRMHYRAFGASRVPMALEIVEPERLADDYVQPGPVAPGNEVRMGIEVDARFGRAQAAWIRERHPGDIRVRVAAGDRFERVDAADLFHLRLIDRWPQTRGEPWMHTAIRKLDSIDQYSSAELQAAQSDAAHFAVIKRAPASEGLGGLASNLVEQKEEGAKPEIAIENGMVQELDPGEELDYHHPTRPNTAIDPFLRYMLREVAAGCGVSYESLSRDYSQTTYSSGRLAILDDRDTWRVLQMWWLRNFRLPLFKRWLSLAVSAGAIPSVPVEQYLPNMAKFEAVKFKPRGWNWVDPTKEVAAYKEAEKAGYISAEDVIAQTANGLDIEDVVEGIKRSRELYAAAGIVRDTDVQTSAPAPQAGAPKPPDPDGDAADDDGQQQQNDPPRRVVSLQPVR